MLANSMLREHNMIRFRQGKPEGIYYSQHSDGAAYDWSHEGLTIKDGRVRESDLLKH
jgi:hypothetical protein